MEPFLEPVLKLCRALLDKDQQEMHRNMEGDHCLHEAVSVDTCVDVLLLEWT